MEKYPSLYTPNDFEKTVRKVGELLDLTGYVEPKYDGSNITVFDGVFRTRNLNPLPKNFEEGLRALGAAYNRLVELSRRYQVFFELGGRRNAPAGYTESWGADWDYVVFDLLRGGLFVDPLEAREIVTSYGLNFVNVSTVRVRDVFEGWREMLNRYNLFEGFVLKIPIDADIARKIPHHRQRNMVIVKFKHEYVTRAMKKRAGKREKTRTLVEKEPMPPSEILGAINKAHMELGDRIFDKKVAMPVIFRYVREEAEKHRYPVPKASVLYRYYLDYVKRVRR